MTAPNRIEFILPNLLILPMISQWILPESLEQLLMLDIFSVTFYFPNVCYFIYIYLYSVNQSWLKEFYMPSVYLHFIGLCMIFFLVNLILTIGIDRYVDVINIFVNDFTFVYAFIIYFYFPLPLRILDNAKYAMILALIILILEVFLFSTGIMTYTSNSGSNLTDGQYETGGIYRVSSTIGAATGTAVIVTNLGIICTSFFRIKKLMRLFLLGGASIAILFTISRGSILVWAAYILIYFYCNYFKEANIPNKFKYLFLFLMILGASYKMGVFNPLMVRQNRLEESGVVMTGRDSRIKNILEITKTNHYLGIGAGLYYPEKSLQGKYEIYNPMKESPHNSYLLILVELGILGILLFTFLYLGVIKNIDFNHPIGLSIPFIFAIHLGVENFPLYQECFPLITFLLLVVYKPLK